MGNEDQEESVESVESVDTPDDSSLVLSDFNREGQLFGLGNPLLDITSAVTDEFLEK